MTSSARKKAPKTIWTPRPSIVASSAVSYARPSVPKPSDAHSTPTPTRPASARSDEDAADEETVLEPQALGEAVEPGVVLADADARVRTGEDAELDHLRADQGQRHEPEHRVDLPRAPEHVDRARGEEEHAEEPEEQERAPGTRKSQLGLYSSMNRTCRHASPKRLSFDSPTRG